jgi:mutator protein MutT
MSEPPNPVVGVGAIVFDDAGRLLVIQRGRAPAAGLWSVPGGKLEPGETLAAAVAREVREETGLEVSVGALVEVIERPPYVILDYRARVVSGTLRAGDDAADARWVTRDELATLPTTPGLEAVVDKARRMP